MKTPGHAKAKAIILVGCGQMGRAMLRGWLASKAAESFYVIEPAGAPEEFRGHVALAFYGSADQLPSPAPLDPEAVVFAVKPQIIGDVLPSYRSWVKPGRLFISIAAGTTIGGMVRHLGEEAAIVRCMPNTPAAIGRAITVACPNVYVTAAQRRLCEALLEAIGSVAWITDEALMDAVTAVSGSGPAYVFLLIEALAAAGERAGLPAKLALRLARETVVGAGELARQSSETPSRLRENVTSPGGTTRAALDILMAQPGLPDLLYRAVAAATARSRELAS